MNRPEETCMLSGKPKVEVSSGCCHSNHTKNCCFASSMCGAILLLLGVVVLLMGRGFLEEAILKSMALTPGSDRLASWLEPPVEAYMEVYAFNIKNPEEVLNAKKPLVEERGPYVYKSVTIKNSDDNMEWHPSDGTLTYRPRKVYTYDPEKSCEGCDPDKDILTFPNIPYWTGMNGARKLSPGLKRKIVIGYILETGIATPFVNLSLSELLWGYDDELPCLKMQDMKPKDCDSGEEDAFDDYYDGGFDEGWGDEDEEQDDFFTEGKTSSKEQRNAYKIPKNSRWEKQVKPKADYVNCKCNWGLFRDRNITMRKPVTFRTGQNNKLNLKGVVTQYNNKDVLNWWQKGSVCDNVKGQDVSVLPPGLDETADFEVFIPLMCRTLEMNFEKHIDHAGIRTLRFIPPANALGSHDDENVSQRNEKNKCYDLRSPTYNKLDFDSKYFKSGVLNLENCKKVKSEDGEYSYPPLVLSQPHFYQADHSFKDAVIGMLPNKDHHQFYIDVVPEFGFPLAMMARFQLNIVIFRMNDVPDLENMETEVVLPFLWAGIGFRNPSETMVNQISFGLNLPIKYPLLISIGLFLLGSTLLLTTLAYFNVQLLQCPVYITRRLRICNLCRKSNLV